MKEAFQIEVYAHDGIYLGNKQVAAGLERYLIEHPTEIGGGQKLLAGRVLADFGVQDTLYDDNDNRVFPRRFLLEGIEQEEVFAGAFCVVLCDIPDGTLAPVEGAVLYLHTKQEAAEPVAVRSAFPMNDPEIQQTAEEIARLANPRRIYLISHKTNQGTGQLISFKLALIVADDTKSISELECFLYTAVDSAYPYDLVLYTESEWASLSQDERTFAASIAKTGTVLYEGGAVE